MLWQETLQRLGIASRWIELAQKAEGATADLREEIRRHNVQLAEAAKVRIEAARGRLANRTPIIATSRHAIAASAAFPLNELA